MDIKEKLSSIQCALKAPKSQFNSFGKYSYRNCEDILEALKPICADYNAVAICSDEIQQVGDRYYVKATATLFDCESEKSISVTAFAREEENKKGMDGSQVTGASSSYARKYALNGLFAIDDTEDADSGDNATETKSEPKSPKLPNPEQPISIEQQMKPPIKQKTRTDLILELIKGSDLSPKDIASKIKEDYKKTKLDELTKEEFNEFYKETKEAVESIESKFD